MTRKGFQAIADMLQSYGMDGQFCDAMADILQKENPRFDRQRFMDAAAPSPPDWDALDRYVKNGRLPRVMIVTHGG